MPLQNDEVLRRWAEDLISKGETNRRYRGGTVHVDADGVLHYERGSGARRMRWGPVVLGRYSVASKTLVLNGDGFTDRHATNWQTQLRNTVRRTITQANGNGKIKHVALIPYAALTAAGVDIESIRPLHIVEDSVEEIWHLAPNPPDISVLQPESHANRETRGAGAYSGTVNGVRYRTSLRDRWMYRKKDDPTKIESSYMRGSEWEQFLQKAAPTGTWQVWGTVQEASGWQTLQKSNEIDLLGARRRREELNNRVLNGAFGQIRVGEIPSERGWYWIEQIHHLGACVFSAVSEDGKRHKFISAFDADEANRMYYLAQLPDRSGATTYDDAVEALAPPIVHQARKEGRVVRRQGDVFAIETKLTDEEVYANARTRVRRRVAIWNLDENAVVRIMRGSQEPVMPIEGEVREKIECPCKCGHKRWSGSGPKARRALMIYGTGHTATEVVVAEKGVTYIRGTMHHDPYLETPGRAAEHANIELPSGSWFLAVRNTVPRRQRQVQQETAEAPTS